MRKRGESRGNLQVFQSHLLICGKRWEKRGKVEEIYRSFSLICLSVAKNEKKRKVSQVFSGAAERLPGLCGISDASHHDIVLTQKKEIKEKCKPVESAEKTLVNNVKTDEEKEGKCQGDEDFVGEGAPVVLVDQPASLMDHRAHRVEFVRYFGQRLGGRHYKNRQKFMKKSKEVINWSICRLTNSGTITLDSENSQDKFTGRFPSKWRVYFWLIDWLIDCILHYWLTPRTIDWLIDPFLHSC